VYGRGLVTDGGLPRPGVGVAVSRLPAGEVRLHLTLAPPGADRQALASWTLVVDGDRADVVLDTVGVVR